MVGEGFHFQIFNFHLILVFFLRANRSQCNRSLAADPLAVHCPHLAAHTLHCTARSRAVVASTLAHFHPCTRTRRPHANTQRAHAAFPRASRCYNARLHTPHKARENSPSVKLQMERGLALRFFFVLRGSSTASTLCFVFGVSFPLSLSLSSYGSFPNLFYAAKPLSHSFLSSVGHHSLSLSSLRVFNFNPLFPCVLVAYLAIPTST
mmetsp:Transcript_35878/g.52623  ORF Transcript_35878/g.52623 Transcript_35878/m.52623 type:complete len:207 (+) Transcript_35878:629-1249(+)